MDDMLPKEPHSDIIKLLPIEGEPVKLKNITHKGRYVIEGRIFLPMEYTRMYDNDENETFCLLNFYVTDEIDTIKCMVIVEPDDFAIKSLKKIQYARVSIDADFDEYEGDEITGRVRQIEPVQKRERPDTAAVKRIELHAHTKMSAMDSVLDVDDYIKRAKKWGHKAVAVTDHGVVHAFPRAYETAKTEKIKLILGMEALVVESDSITSKLQKPGTAVVETADNEEKNEHSCHIIILVRNQTGLKNLYKVVSMSHIDYLRKKLCIPRAKFEEHREGLLLGNACNKGELYQAILAKKSETEVERIAGFYDYLEIQPRENNKFLKREGIPISMDELQEINIKIYELGRKLERPVVATGDVHYLDKTDNIYREVLLSGNDTGKESVSTWRYFKTTDEMLEEFAYLGEKEAREVVVENCVKVNALIEDDIKPVPEGLHPPIFAGAEKEIDTLSRKAAEKLFGNSLPPEVSERLNSELQIINDFGYSAIYHIAKTLVEKSHEAGYMVISRGAVGSSLVAYLTGISEVNPLAAYYRCADEKCGYIMFVKTQFSGTDLPDKQCPQCGKKLLKDGFNLPFETLTGFDGKKIPDIDLSFAGEFQKKIPGLLDTLLGSGKVYGAGTVVTLGESAVKRDLIGKYSEKSHKTINRAGIERLIRGCIGVKRTTGQQLGGFILVPEDNDITDFTPVQLSKNRDSITTHFDYIYLQDSLVKVDAFALPHDIPASMKKICGEIGLKAEDIPLDDSDTMEIFSGTKTLKVNSENYEFGIGTAGLPEYGIRFVRRIIAIAKPKTFSGLVSISGLSHGTDVWRGNAEVLIREKIAKLSEVIALRDDIMIFLMSKGLAKDKAYDIMESVRRGRGLSGEDEKLMGRKGIPDWYMQSCNKIKYLFPKAHAIAYAMMSFKLAYIKVHHPGHFYADYFDRKIKVFDYNFAFMPVKDLEKRIRKVRDKEDSSPKEREQMDMMEVVMEMKERGLDFISPDVKDTDTTRFKVSGYKIIMPSVVFPEK